MLPAVGPAGQSAAQLVLDSPASQTPLPHLLAAGQSLGQLAVVSEDSQVPLPHTAPGVVPPQSAAVHLPPDLAQAAITALSLALSGPVGGIMSAATYWAMAPKLAACAHDEPNWCPWQPLQLFFRIACTAVYGTHVEGGVVVLQSAGQPASVSPVSHVPLPQTETGLVPLQPAWMPHVFSAVLSGPEACGQVRVQAEVAHAAWQFNAAAHLASALHAAISLGHLLSSHTTAALTVAPVEPVSLPPLASLPVPPLVVSPWLMPPGPLSLLP